MANEPADPAAAAESTRVDFGVVMFVRSSGDHVWHRRIIANSGDHVEYRIGYENSSRIQHNDVIVKVTLPPSIEYIPATTHVKNASNPVGEGLNVHSDAVVAEGINIGNYAPDANAWVLFKARIDSDAPVQALARALIATQIGAKENTAVVDITSVSPSTSTARPPAQEEVVPERSQAVAPTWFLSHASVDAEFAATLRRRLLDRGVTGWLAQEDIGPSENYAASIVSAIERADRLIVILSAAALNSVHVQREVSLGLRFGKPLVPLYLKHAGSSWRDLELPSSWVYWLEISQVLEVADPDDAVSRLTAHR